MKETNLHSKLNVAVTFFVAIVLPILLFFLTNRRALEISILFGRDLLKGKTAYVALLIGYLAARALFRKLASVFPHKSIWRQLTYLHTLSTVYLRRDIRFIVALLLISAALSFNYLQLRYKYFSEVAYQAKAIEMLEQGNISRARLICSRYVRLYPQRSTHGALPDPICTELLDYTNGMSSIYRYVSSQNPAPERAGDLALPVDFSSRRSSLEVLKHLSAK